MTTSNNAPAGKSVEDLKAERQSIEDTMHRDLNEYRRDRAMQRRYDEVLHQLEELGQLGGND